MLRRESSPGRLLTFFHVLPPSLVFLEADAIEDASPCLASQKSIRLHGRRNRPCRPCSSRAGSRGREARPKPPAKEPHIAERNVNHRLIGPTPGRNVAARNWPAYSETSTAGASCATALTAAAPTLRPPPYRPREDPSIMPPNNSGQVPARPWRYCRVARHVRVATRR